MEFAKYYNVTSLLEKMINEGKLESYTKDYCKGLYICEDTHDIWVSRILENMNDEYDNEKGIWLVERNKIDKYDFCEFLKEKKNDDSEDSEINNRNSRDYYINECFEVSDILEHIILMDDDNGLENWDNYQCYSYDECIESIDGGFGIIELEAVKTV